MNPATLPAIDQPQTLRQRPKLTPDSSPAPRTSRIQAAEALFVRLANSITGDEAKRDELADMVVGWVAAVDRADGISKQDPAYPAAAVACAIFERELGALLRRELVAVYVERLPHQHRAQAHQETL